MTREDKVALIVDDDPRFCSALERVLETFGYRGLIATSGEEGLGTLAANRVDVLLLDLRMPGMQGQEMLAQVVERHPDLPVVVVSGTSKVDDLVEVFRYNVVDFIRKPPDLDALREALERAEARQPRRTPGVVEKTTPQGEPAPEPCSETAVDPDAAVVLLVDDEANYRAALRHALEDRWVEVIDVGSGADALEVLGQRPVDIVISDHVMPDMDGTTLLETVRQRWPEAARVLLTAYPGSDVFMEAVNRGGVHKALAKQLPVQRLIGEIDELVNGQLARERTKQ
jgi:DNA-binding NtrC family response regulator